MGVARRTTTTTAPSADEYTAPAADEADNGLTAEDENDSTERSSSVVKRGWGAATSKIKETSTAQYANDWTPPEGETLVKFLEDEPFASVGQHWVDEIAKGKRSFYCREDDCPLCGVGHKPSALVYFNVVVLGTDQEPEVVALKAGPMLTDIIKQENEGRGGPLSRHFWVLKKTVTKAGKGTKTNYSLNVVKARDLVEDFEIDPETVAASLADLEPYTEDIIKIPSKQDLQEIVEEHLSND